MSGDIVEIALIWLRASFCRSKSTKCTTITKVSLNLGEIWSYCVVFYRFPFVTSCFVFSWMSDFTPFDLCFFLPQDFDKMGGKGNGKDGRGGRKGRGEPNWNNNALKQAFEIFRPKSRGAWEPVLMHAPNISGKILLRYKIISSSGVSRPSCTRPLRACDNSKGPMGKHSYIVQPMACVRD